MTDVLTWFGGGTDDYVQVAGAPIPNAPLDVWDTAVPSTGTKQTDLRQYDAAGVLQTVTQVHADGLGYYLYAINNWGGGASFLDPGITGLAFRFQVDPNNLVDRLLAVEGAVAATPAAPVDHGLWTNGVLYKVGDYFTSPTTGERRVVVVRYTTGSTYGSTDIGNSIPTSSAAAAALTPVALQNADYAPAAGALVPMDTTGGARVVNLPASPPNRSQIAVKIAAQSGGNGVTLQAQGTQRFNIVGGTVSAYPLALFGQCVVLQYDNTGATPVWHVLSDTAPPASLDLRYAPIAWSQAAADLRYAPLGAYLKTVAMWTGDLLFKGFDEDSNGLDMIAAGAIHQLDAVVDLPPEGADVLADVYRLKVADNTEALIGTVTIAASTAHGQLTYTGSSGGNPDPTFADGDKIFVRLRQVGSTFAGAGLKVRIALGGRTFPVFPTPGVPTGLGIIASDSISATLQWANGSGSSQVIVYRTNAAGNLVPYWNVGSATTFRDLGPDGVSGLAQGETHLWAVRARRGSEVSALSGTVSGGSIAYSAWIKTDGTLDTTVVTPTVGSGGTAGQGISTVTQNTSPALLLKGGNTGSNNIAADRVMLKGIVPAGAHSGYAVNTLVSPFNSSSLFEWDIASTDQDLSGTVSTNFLQFQASVSALRFGGKFGAWVPTSTTGNGTTAGTFQNISDPAYPVNLLGSTTRTSSGGLPYGFTLVSTAKYGFRFEVQPPTGSGGTLQQVVVVRFGNETQYGVRGATAASMPVFATMTVSADRQAYRVPGYVFFQQLGTPAAGGTQQGSYLYDFQVAALTATGA